jgi:hypothetical protein
MGLDTEKQKERLKSNHAKFRVHKKSLVLYRDQAFVLFGCYDTFVSVTVCLSPSSWKSRFHISFFSTWYHECDITLCGFRKQLVTTVFACLWPLDCIEKHEPLHSTLYVFIRLPP